MPGGFYVVTLSRGCEGRGLSVHYCYARSTAKRFRSADESLRTGAGRNYPDRPAELSLFPAATLPGRDRCTVSRRYCLANSPYSAPVKKRDGARTRRESRFSQWAGDRFRDSRLVMPMSPSSHRRRTFVIPPGSFDKPHTGVPLVSVAGPC